ncbi:MAG: lysophospholipid acyltransferase family protein [Chloroflexota bacterium]
MGYKITRWITNLIIRLTTRLEIHGLERIPRSGSFVIASNHLGRLDPALVYHFLDREDIIMLVAEKYQKNPLLRWFARQLDAIFVNRFEADFNAVRQALKRLHQGGVLVLAPEGTRSPTAALIEGRHGVSFLAAKASVPIYPVALAGSEDRKVYPQLKRLRRAHVIVRVGEPFTLPPLSSKERDAVLHEYTGEIMCRIAALLPPEYRGVYADHPRLRELLSQALP